MLIRAITRVNLSVAREREMLKGMSEHLQKDQQLLERLDELLKRYEAGDEPLHEAFTADEVAALKRVATREMAYLAIGKLGSSLKALLTYIGFFIGIYLAAKAGVIEWIKSVVGQ